MEMTRVEIRLDSSDENVNIYALFVGGVKVISGSQDVCDEVANNLLCLDDVSYNLVVHKVSNWDWDWVSITKDLSKAEKLYCSTNKIFGGEESIVIETHQRAHAIVDEVIHYQVNKEEWEAQLKIFGGDENMALRDLRESHKTKRLHYKVEVDEITAVHETESFEA